MHILATLPTLTNFIQALNIKDTDALYLLYSLSLSISHSQKQPEPNHFFSGLRINLALCSGVDNLDLSIKQFTGEEGENCVWL